MELLKRAASFPNWTRTPIPGFDISAAGLLALADLGTIAERTRLVGGSSWIDALLLAPGLHYQQAADALFGEGGFSSSSSSAQYRAVELTAGKMSTYDIMNSATLRYLQRAGIPGQRVIVDVGMMPEQSNYYSSFYRRRNRKQRRRRSQHKTIWQDHDAVDLGWLSHLLYLASPVLTVTALVFMILFQEWWGVASLVALMVSRILNIWVIKQRSKPPVVLHPPHHTHHHDRHDHHDHEDRANPLNLLTEYNIDLGHGKSVCLRGIAEDLQAITISSWLSAKTHVEGYLEAAAKLIVYVVAALSGNMSQAGSIIFLLLLLINAGLLGLSNAHAKTFRMHGRLAAPTVEVLPQDGSRSGAGHDRHDPHGRTGSPPYPDSSANASTSWPNASTSDDPTSSGFLGMDDFAEQGQIGRRVGDRRPFDKATEYR